MSKHQKILNKLLPNSNNDELHELYKQPIKENSKETPHFFNGEANFSQQMDTLYLPSDYGYKYLLVVVDTSSKLMDAEKMKSHSASAVTNALKKIYSRDILKVPKVMTVDSGAENKGETKNYLESLDVKIVVAETQRHRQIALAENRNKQIGSLILKFQTALELEKGKTVKSWVKVLPIIIDELNNDVKPSHQIDPFKEPVFTKRNKNILPLDTEVRVKLEYAQDTFGKKLHGTFRSSDIKWSRKIYKINNIVLNPEQPPMYGVTDNKKILRTVGQLQVV
jgi:hypothetical protein